MRQEDTKQKIIEKALELFSERGYDSVSVGEIAQAVGIKAPSLYNHYPSKQAIFEAIVASTAERYQRDTDKIQIHVEDDRRDASAFVHITEEALFQKVRQIFEYSLHDDVIHRFRKMMTIEQFRSLEREGECLEKLRKHVGLFFRMLIFNWITVKQEIG